MGYPPAVQPRALAVLRFSSLGDIVLSSGALAACKTAWPETRILYVTKNAFRPLMESNPHVHSVLAVEDYPHLPALAHDLALSQVDAVLDLHGKLRSRILRGFLGGRPTSVWTNKPWWQRLLVGTRLIRYHAREPIAVRYHHAVETLAGRALPIHPLTHYISQADQRMADQLLEAENLTSHQPIVGMSPGAAWHTKRWPVDRFAELARQFSDAGAQVIITGSPAERDHVAAIRARCPQLHDFVGSLSLGQLGGVIGRCHLFVANDSGPLHIARGLGVPTVSVFGSTDPGMFRFTATDRVLRRELPCSPCALIGKNACPEGHFRCMLDISPTEVFNAGSELVRL